MSTPPIPDRTPIPAHEANDRRILLVEHRRFELSILGREIDAAFDTLYVAHHHHRAMPWGDFTTAAHHFFDAVGAYTPAHERYFNNFTPLWQELLSAGNYDGAEELWDGALRPALSWEEHQHAERVHKGTPYYFWAMTALLRGNTDHGYLLMHQAVDEDTRTNAHAMQDRPGYWLVSLNHGRVDQAFREWVIAQAQFFDDCLASYRGTYNRTLTVDDVRRRFIDRPTNTETSFLLTYTIARLRNLAVLPAHATKNPFAGQLELNILFDIVVVIEVGIRSKNPTTQLADGRSPTFVHHAEHLLAAAGHALTNTQLRDINKQFNADFDVTLQSAVDGTLRLRNNNAIDRFQADVAVAYGIRNRGAHTTSAVPTIWNRFPDIQRALFRVLAVTIDSLYP